MNQKSSYQKLCAEFYDLTKPEAGPKEIAFYENLIKNTKGPFLEAMCGSGRLLIPLLKKGYKIDGVDNSAPMLESCARRCKEQGLQVELFNHSLEKLSLPKKYGLIFIAIGSFQLFKERSQALSVLQKLRENLLPRGVLLLETYIPWDSIKGCIEGPIIMGKSHAIDSMRKVASPEGYEIILSTKTIVYPTEQIESWENLYIKEQNGRVLEREQEALAVRWYYRYEMELFLEKSGFIIDKVFEESFEENPQAVLYRSFRE
jgi:SAM-dependent methyltransferase